MTDTENTPLPPVTDVEEMSLLAVEALEDIKGKDIVNLDTRALTSVDPASSRTSTRTRSKTSRPNASACSPPWSPSAVCADAHAPNACQPAAPILG